MKLFIVLIFMFLQFKIFPRYADLCKTYLANITAANSSFSLNEGEKEKGGLITHPKNSEIGSIII